MVLFSHIGMVYEILAISVKRQTGQKVRSGAMSTVKTLEVPANGRNNVTPNIHKLS
jgi:hypothetical protein